MAKPDVGLIKETNSQYYAGAQMFVATADQTAFTATLVVMILRPLIII